MSTGPLAAAEGIERALREQLADLVRARSRAATEARRLAERASLPGADPSLAGLSERYMAQADRLASEVDELRKSLREQEARVERLRAEASGA